MHSFNGWITGIVSKTTFCLSVCASISIIAATKLLESSTKNWGPESSCNFRTGVFDQSHLLLQESTQKTGIHVNWEMNKTRARSLAEQKEVDSRRKNWLSKMSPCRTYTASSYNREDGRFPEKFYCRKRCFLLTVLRKSYDFLKYVYERF